MTTRMAYTGNDNESGRTLDAFKRMWIGVVHPPRRRARGCFCWRPSSSHGCQFMNVDHSAVKTPCNHPAMAAFLQLSNQIKIRWGKRSFIVNRQSITVKPPIHRSDTHFGRVRSRIRASFRARKTPISRFRAHKTPISSVAALGIVRNASLFRRAGGASTSAQGQQPVYIVGRS